MHETLIVSGTVTLLFVIVTAVRVKKHLKDVKDAN